MRFKFLLFIIFLGCNTVSSGQRRGPVIDEFSRSSCFVQSARGSTLLKGGTGFFLEVNGKTYFITNNHVVGGEFAVEEHVRILKTPFPADSIPDKIYIRVFDSLYERTTLMTLMLSELNTIEYLNFWEDPNRKKLMDIIAVPVSDSLKVLLTQTNILSERNLQKNLLLQPSTELYVVGFPLISPLLSAYPIWKRGTVASETDLISVQQSSFLIDATTRGGMSGSPVFYRSTSYNGIDGSYNVNNKPITFLVGIYSAQFYEMELGKVWRLDRVIETLKNIP